MSYDNTVEGRRELESAWCLEEGALSGINILFADYTYEDYSGSAFVLYEENGKLYSVHGSHCSCRGLEGQWDPEETSVEQIRHTLEHGYAYDGYKDEVRDALKQFKKGRRMKKITYFEAADGTRFDDELECMNYEQICELEAGIRNASSGVSQASAREIAKWFVETYTFEAI